MDNGFDPNQISQCENSCVNFLSNFPNKAKTLSKKYIYVFTNCLRDDDQSFCVSNSSETTLMTKSAYFMNYNQRLAVYLLIDENYRPNKYISFEEYSFFKCSGVCLLKSIKSCFKASKCDIGLSNLPYNECVIGVPDDVKTDFIPWGVQKPKIQKPVKKIPREKFNRKRKGNTLY